MKHNKNLVKIFIISILVLSLSISLIACSNNGVKLMDGDTLIKSVKVNEGEAYDFGAAEKFGYEFLGWYSEKEGGSPYTDNKGNSAGLKWAKENARVLYAHWNAKTFDVVFNYEGATSGNSIESVTLTYGNTITDIFPVPSKEGFSFKGWFSKKENGKQITNENGEFLPETKVFDKETFEIDEKANIYAVWDVKKVTYNFITKGIDEIQSVTYKVNDIIKDMPSAVKEGYCFEGWYFDKTCLNALELPYQVPSYVETLINLYPNFVEGSNDILRFNVINQDKEYEVSYSGNAEEIVIPDLYFGKKVTKIAKIDAPNAKRIIIPQTVVEIGNDAFNTCAKLVKINLPTKLEKIPSGMLENAKNLDNIFIPQTVKFIGARAFKGCNKITNIELPKNLETIEEAALANMSSLKSISIEAGNEKYECYEGVLYYKIGVSLQLLNYPANKLAETYQIHEKTNKIRDYAFNGAKLKYISIGKKISEIGEGAFSNCANLSNVIIEEGNQRLVIKDKAFLNCANLKSLIVKMNVVPTLGAQAFNNVPNTFSIYVLSDILRQFKAETNWRDKADRIYSTGKIFGDYALEEYNGNYLLIQYLGNETEVEIPSIINAKKVVKIGDGAFSNNLDLTKVIINKEITEIGNNAFEQCASLKSIIVKGNPATLGTNAFKNINFNYGIYVDGTTELLETYKSANGWNAMKENIWSYSGN